jgi:hypothetical protein
MITPQMVTAKCYSLIPAVTSMSPAQILGFVKRLEMVADIWKKIETIKTQSELTHACLPSVKEQLGAANFATVLLKKPVVSLRIFFRSYRRNHVPWGRLSL